MQLKYNHYALFDKVSGTVVSTFVSANDGLAVRETLLTLRVPIRDSEIYQIGTLTHEVDNDKVSPFGASFYFDCLKVPRLVSWESYKFPENVAEALAPLGASSEELHEVLNNRLTDKKEF